MTTKHEVIAVHRANPTWSPGDIAHHLGCISAYVRATARRNKLNLPSGLKSVSPAVLRARAAELIRRAEQIEAQGK